MGWTSFPYQKSEHLNWNFHQALSFAENNFGTEGFSIKRFYLEKARTMHDRNTIYCTIKAPNGNIFAMAVLVDIINEELFHKEIPSSMGPIADRCPVSFLAELPEPKNAMDLDCRKRVLRNNVWYDDTVV